MTRNRLPQWFRQDIPNATAWEITQCFSRFNLHTVCQEAKCPNFGYCFKNRQFTFMLLGDACTRSCKFCNVNRTTGVNLNLDADEPYRIAQAVKMLNLDYLVITSVTRDDLPDGGARQFAKTLELIHSRDKNINPVTNTKASKEQHKICNGVKIEILIPDFSGNFCALKTVIDATPSLLAHNIETVKRLYPDIRPQACYNMSLGILNKAKEFRPSLLTKSSLMLGLGETEDEVIQVMQDLRLIHCDILTLGQYLAPSEKHYPVQEFISIEQFQRYQRIGLALGFKAVLSGPKVRSSYQAEQIYREVAYV